MTTSSSLILPTRSHAVARDLRALLGAEKVKDDMPTITAYAVSRGIPLTPRAAGTNLTGSAIGSGVILDISRLNRILEVNREARWARVQPGIVLAELNK